MVSHDSRKAPRLARAARFAAGLALVSLGLASCASPAGRPTGESPGAAAIPGPGGILLTVEPGRRWIRSSFVFMRFSPTFAGWVETADGEYAETLLVSGKAGTGSWIGSPEGGRPEALPVWYQASGVSPEKPAEPDAVSAASSDAGAAASRGPAGLESGHEYVVRFEINHSYDYNETWKSGGKPGDEGWSGVNGQPSVVYEARFIAGVPGTAELKAVGRGSPDGSVSGVIPSLEGLTTALEIVKKITLEVR